MNKNYPAPYNDSPLSTISRQLNATLGDTSGRTITSRTAQGMKRILDLPELNEDTAGHIVHGGMVGFIVLLSRKNNIAFIIAIVVLIILFVCYQRGKEYSFPEKLLKTGPATPLFLQ